MLMTLNFSLLTSLAILGMQIHTVRVAEKLCWTIHVDRQEKTISL